MPDGRIKVSTVVSTVISSTFSKGNGWLQHFFSSMMRFRNVVFGPIPFPLVPLFSFAKFFVNNHRKKPLLRRSHSNPQHVASLLRERLSTPIFCLRMMEGCNVLCSSTTHPSSPKAEKEKLPSNATRTSKWSKFKKCSNARSSATEFCRGVSVTNNRFADESPAKYLRSALSLFYGRCTSSSAIKCDGVTVEPRNYGMNF